MSKEETAMRLLEKLTPQGSEFYNDPEFCYEYLQRVKIQRHKIIKKLVLKNRELLKRLKERGGRI